MGDNGAMDRALACLADSLGLNPAQMSMAFLLPFGYKEVRKLTQTDIRDGVTLAFDSGIKLVLCAI